MPAYEYVCRQCGTILELWNTIREGPLPADTITCPDCHEHSMRRSFASVNIGQVPQEVYSHSAGRSFSDNKQVDEHIKRLTESNFQRDGYATEIVSRHPSEVKPVEGESLDNVYRQKMARGESTPKVIRTMSD